MTVGSVSEIDGDSVEAAFIMAPSQDFRGDGEEFAFVVRGAAAFRVPPDDRRPEYIPFSVNHTGDVWLYIVVSLQGDAPAKVGISLNAFVVIFQAPLSVAGGR